MGKVRQSKRHSAKKQYPTGIPSVKEAEAVNEQEQETEMKKISSTVSSLVEKLQSPSSDEQECACTTIASLLSQDGAVEQFLLAGLVKVIGPLILAKNPKIRETSLGVLRNMSVEGSLAVCDEMIEQDVMTPLVTLFQKVNGSSMEETMESSEAKACNSDLHEEETILLQAINLLWNLCETSPIAVKIFNQSNLLEVVLPHVCGYEKNIQLALASAQCIYAVSDNNPDAIDAIIKAGMPKLFSEALQSQPSNNAEILMLTVLSGILNNIGPEGLNSAAGSILSAVVSFLAKTLDLEIIQSLKDAAAIAQELSTTLSETDKPSDESQSKPTHESPSDIQHKKLALLLEETKYLVSAQQLAIEIIANLSCSREDNEWEDMDESSDGSSDEIGGSVEMEETVCDDTMQPLCVPQEVHEAFVTNCIMKKILAKSEPVDLLFCTREATKLKIDNLVLNVSALQNRALLCLGNLLSVLDVPELGGEAGLLQVWSGLSQMAASNAVKENDETLEAVTGALRAVVQKLYVLGSPKLMEVTENDLQFLCEIVQGSKVPHIRVNALRIVAGFGCALARSPTVHPQLKNISTFMLQIVAGDSELWVIAEALDAIFDVFAEDHTDVVLKETQMMETLNRALPELKTKMKQQRKHISEHLPIISTAKMNLVRFIKYKSSRISLK